MFKKKSEHKWISGSCDQRKIQYYMKTGIRVSLSLLAWLTQTYLYTSIYNIDSHQYYV